ncbi:hypothetical protein QCA50_017767 [Cerrena zonata]|uniref:Uncharacterized protein n=1 Tax=Cerrena zonata TaxID=2478898 RepID=A0AAW0FJS6_9APHY
MMLQDSARTPPSLIVLEDSVSKRRYPVTWKILTRSPDGGTSAGSANPRSPLSGQPRLSSSSHPISLFFYTADNPREQINASVI